MQVYPGPGVDNHTIQFNSGLPTVINLLSVGFDSTIEPTVYNSSENRSAGHPVCILQSVSASLAEKSVNRFFFNSQPPLASNIYLQKVRRGYFLALVSSWSPHMLESKTLFVKTKSGWHCLVEKRDWSFSFLPRYGFSTSDVLIIKLLCSC